MFSMMFHRLTRTNFVHYNLVIRFNLSLSVNQTSHFSNFADFRQLQIPNARTKYYEILPTHTETPHNTNHKIANRYFEFRYHFVTLHQKIPITFEQGCPHSNTFMVTRIQLIPVFITSHDPNTSLYITGPSVKIRTNIFTGPTCKLL